MNKNITQKQKVVLELIYNSIKDCGFPPSLVDLKEKLGVSSNQAILNFLDSLEKGGCIKRSEGKRQARGIKILPLGYKIMEKEPLIQMVGISQAGSFIQSFAESFEKWVSLPSVAVLNEDIRQAEDNVFIIQVNGDSMINAGINDGDVLLIKKTEQFRSGDIVVARSDDGTTVKRFVAESDGRAYLKPENPNYKIIPIFEDTYFDGKVIANLSVLNK